MIVISICKIGRFIFVSILSKYQNDCISVLVLVQLSENCQLKPTNLSEQINWVDELNAFRCLWIIDFFLLMY